LSIDSQDVPAPLRDKGQRTFRSITVDGREIEFSEGFTDLHTVSYQQILNGQGFGPEQSRSAISAVAHIRSATPLGLAADSHPALVAALKSATPT